MQKSTYVTLCLVLSACGGDVSDSTDAQDAAEWLRGWPPIADGGTQRGDAGTTSSPDAGSVVDATASGTTGQATGIYVVDDGDMTNFNQALTKSFVDGALVRVHWSQMEASDGNYTFTSLCDKVTAAANAGKKVSLANFALAPTWLVSSLPTTEVWTNGNFGSQPVPWSQTAQKKMQDWVTAESTFQCNGYALKDHPAISQIDTPILGMQSIRKAPTYTLSQLTDAVKTSVSMWHTAFGETGHKFYTGLFPVGTSTTDATSIRDAVQALYPNQHWFQETWTGAGPSGSLATPLDPNASPRKFFVMLQACGYWSNQSKIKCSFASSDSPQVGYDNVATQFQAKYFEIYPADLTYSGYQTMLQSIHTTIWK